MVSRRDVGFVAGVLAGLLLLAGAWLVSLLITGALVLVSVVEELARQRHRAALLAEVVQFRVLLKERQLDLLTAHLAFSRPSLAQAAHAPGAR